jgi:CheY-like chemotaxis protein
MDTRLPGARPLTILIAEDGDDDLFFMKRALRATEVSYELRVVTDGQEAIDYLAGESGYEDRKQWPLPDLIFLDLKMPRQNGFEVLEWIRAHPELRSSKVVVLTGSPELRDRQRAQALGVQAYLVKPPTGEALKELLASF